MTDVLYTCKLCKVYETASKQSLITHLQRKKICSKSTEFTREFLINELVTKEYNTITFDCIYCQKKFNHRSNRSKHTKICKRRNTVTLRQVNNVTLMFLFLLENIYKFNQINKI